MGLGGQLGGGGGGGGGPWGGKGEIEVVRGAAFEALAVERENPLDVLLSLGVRWNSAVAVHREVAGVVGSECQRQIPPVAENQTAQVSNSPVDILPGIEDVADAQDGGGLGHELHEALGPLARDRPRVKPGFDLNDRLDEAWIHPVPIRGLLDLLRKASSGTAENINPCGRAPSRQP